MKPTQEQVIEWAREAQKQSPRHAWNSPAWFLTQEAIEDFAALAYEAGRKDENEVCAKVCEHNAAFGNSDERYASRECAAAIRARREQ